MEEWKNLPNFEDYFSVSSFGKVLDKKTNTLRHPSVYKNGYVYFEFWLNKIRYRYRLHTLVAQLFITNPENKSEVHHIDENRQNNRVDNLMWVTPEEHKDLHKQTGTRNRKISEMLINHPNLSKPVEQYTLNNEFVAEYPSAEEAARQTHCSRGNISNCCSKRKGFHTCKGFIWKYKET